MAPKFTGNFTEVPAACSAPRTPAEDDASGPLIHLPADTARSAPAAPDQAEARPRDMAATPHGPLGTDSFCRIEAEPPREDRCGFDQNTGSPQDSPVPPSQRHTLSGLAFQGHHHWFHPRALSSTKQGVPSQASIHILPNFTSAGTMR